MTSWYRFKEDVNLAPEKEGAYLLSETSSDFGIVYVGRVDNLQERLQSHLDPQNPCLQRKSIKFFAFEVTMDSEAREAELIDDHDPECNRE